jgi:UDP-glucose 4-epimerase
MRILVTGGCGFIGSHLVDQLVKEHEITVLDKNINSEFKNDKVKYIEGNLLNPEDIQKCMPVDAVFHLAANVEVKTGVDNTHADFDNNITATFNVLEVMRKNNVKRIVFTSSSTVYGETETIPTPEDYGILKPISLYGGSKLACEAMVSSYCGSFGFKGTVFRFANIIGSRATHGVILDFINKLRATPDNLEILGDGKQCKSYLHVSDCVNAIILATNKQESDFDVYNVGSEQQTTVTDIGKVVAEEMKLKPTFSYTGGSRGWVGDIPKFLLDVKKIMSLGWEYKYSSTESIRKTVQELL